MTRSMFGIRYKPDAEILCPFRARVSWLCHFIGLHPMLRYAALTEHFINSLKGARYTNDGYSPSDIGATIKASLKGRDTLIKDINYERSRNKSRTHRPVLKACGWGVVETKSPS